MLGHAPRWFVYLAFLVGLAACGGGGGGDAPPRAKTTTLLVYMVGSDLESGRGPLKGTSIIKGNATINIEEMLRARSSDKVNVVLTTGGAAKDDPSKRGLVKTWRTVKRHIVKNGKIEELQDLGKVDMGQPGTLTEFIKWGKEAYPADRYMLMFWNHGGGHHGFGGDENFPGADGRPKLMGMPNIAKALADAKQATGVTFDFIGFDACLMSAVEVANALAPFGHYLGASQELEPGTGWSWKSIIEALADDPGIPAPAFGRILADTFIEKQIIEAEVTRRSNGAAYLEDKYNTFAITDLGAMPKVTSALERFADAMLASRVLDRPDTWLQVAQARAASASFAGQMTSRSDGYDVVDLYNLAQRMAAANIVRAESEALQEAVRSAVVYRKNGDFVRDTANGLSAFFPSRSVGDSGRKMLDTLYAVQQVPASYKTMLKAFVATAAESTHILAIDTPRRDAGAVVAPVTTTFGIREAYTVLSHGDDGGQPGTVVIDGIMRADGVSSYGSLSMNPDNRWVTLNGHPFAATSIENIPGPDGSLLGFEYAIPILFNDDPEPATLVVHESDARGFEVVGVWHGTNDSQLGSRSGEAVKPDDRITLLRVVADTQNNDFRLVRTPMAPVFKAESMFFWRTPLAPGDYRVRFAVTDFRERNAFSDYFDYPVR